MAMTPLADKGNILHIFDFKVKDGMGGEFIKRFEKFDYSDDNPMHKSPAQVRDGVLCRAADDPNRFFLIGEWKSIAEHKEILPLIAELKPDYAPLLADGPASMKPLYVEVVVSTPQEILDKA
ncbi:antibiotic biosynthesis monooxygenase family protein [Chachezhania antarctica]|uniref:antibiotic biosynthesis monooxygenase family protein n=1 Tax=Chachezhania antarctica TaxID=2340860 RepID=UPI000EACEA81|nr:hypothetical protein [Chachezhania antarctica]|tara:strand:+ start:8711 stop:9076 length:366 start_codon:yes stop_codon:yes gene_type:complete